MVKLRQKMSLKVIRREGVGGGGGRRNRGREAKKREKVWDER